MNRLAAALVLLVVLSACERAEAPAPPQPPPPRTVPATSVALDPAMERTAECVDPGEGFAVPYPADWHRDPAELIGPCALFHPEPFQLPRDSEVPIEIVVQIGFHPVFYADLAGDVLGREVISREPAMVDGRRAVRILAETTGDGLHDRGIRYQEYVVDLGEESMTAVTYDRAPLDFDRRRRILDAMMRGFDFREPGR
jgi:hypothetical protein